MLKLLEVGCALATDPDVLLLDEPSSGMGPEEAHQLGDRLLGLRRDLGLTMLLIEHHVPLVTAVCDYVYVLNFGRLLAEGEPSLIRTHPEVVAAYLGGEAPLIEPLSPKDSAVVSATAEVLPPDVTTEIPVVPKVAAKARPRASVPRASVPRASATVGVSAKVGAVTAKANPGKTAAGAVKAAPRKTAAGAVKAAPRKKVVKL